MMNLPESLDVLNKRLKEHYGFFATTNNPKFRIVWSEELTEKRFRMNTTEVADGVYKESDEVVEVKKYEYLDNKFVLEEMQAVENSTSQGLCTNLSYEPRWVYGRWGDPYGESLPATWTVTKFIIDEMLSKRGRKKSIEKDPEIAETPEEKQIRLDALVKELWPNETETGDAMAYKEAITDFNPKVNFDS
jgi:hypothetical protein